MILILETLSKKRPTELLNPSDANNLYKAVPTEAANFLGLNKLMGKAQSHTPYVKYTAREPISGLMKSVKHGTKSPISDKREFATEKHIIVKFKDSLVFDENDLFTIAQAERADARDAEIREAAMMILTHVEGLKLKNQYTKEKLFWEGMLGQMNVTQVSQGTETDIQITTGTRSLTALASTATWDYHVTTSMANSTADPLLVSQRLVESFTGKGGKLKTVYLNQLTFDYMITIPRFRDNMKYTTSRVEELSSTSVTIGGVMYEVYNEGYLNDAKTFVPFIPNGYVIGCGAGNSQISGGFADYVECLNVDAKQPDTYNIEAVYGTFFRIKSTDDPVSSQFLISNYGLPVIKNPQLVVYCKVF